jgi:hypothetical protein
MKEPLAACVEKLNQHKRIAGLLWYLALKTTAIIHDPPATTQHHQRSLDSHAPLQLDDLAGLDDPNKFDSRAGNW